jgi:ATP-dependent exoDNAse (exonuclease V) alpha subunit
MLTLRPFNKDGSWAAKSRKEYILDENGERIQLKSGAYKTRKISAVDWNDQANAEVWRQSWADTVNAALERGNHAERIDHDYTRKGGVVHTEILLPEHAPQEYSDRAILWNAVEMAERNRNAQLAREIELALPVELTRGQNISLVRDYVKQQFVEKGMCADVCIHDKNDVPKGISVGQNPHAHIMLTLRPFDKDGAWAAKSKKEYILDENGERIQLKSGAYKTRKISAVDWNDQANAEAWRQGWADAVNAELERHGAAERIDHRSYERQGIEQVPTVHLGVAASQMERRGISTDRGNLNREIEITNSQLRQLRARIIKLTDWLKDAAANTAPPTLADVIQSKKNNNANKYG